MEFLIFLIIAGFFGLLTLGMLIIFRKKSKALENQVEKLEKEGNALAASFADKNWLSRR